jgi:NADH dehydrogenase/NADH:ubiquinone oxidoreductase subunit G
LPSSNTVKEKKKKKRIGLLDLGDYESYQDLLEAARQKAKKPGQSVEPAVPQPKLPKEDKKKQTQNLWLARKSGWTDCRGNPVGGVSRPKTKPKSTLDDMNETPKVDQNQHQGKMKGKKPVAAPPKVPEKSIIQQLNETEATFRAAEAAEAAAKAKKKKPVKKEPAKGAKGKGKGKGKAGGDEVEKITFQRLRKSKVLVILETDHSLMIQPQEHLPMMATLSLTVSTR